MNLIDRSVSRSWLVLLLVAALLGKSQPVGAQAVGQADPEAEPPVARFETTALGIELDPKVLVYTEPVREDGTIDYVAALDQKYRAGVTKNNNAFVPLFLTVSRFARDDGWGEREPEMRQIASKLEVTEAELEAGPFFVSWDVFAERKGYDPDTAYELYSAFADAPFSGEPHADLLAWIEQNEPAFERIAQAVQRERYWSPLIGDETGLLVSVLLPQLGDHRALARALQVRAYLAARDGDTETLLATLSTLRRLAWHQSHEPFLLSGLVAISIDALTAATVAESIRARKLPEQALAEIAKTLPERPARLSIAEAILEGERCFALDAYMQILAGRVGSGAFMIGGDDENDPAARLMRSGAFDINRGLRQFSRHYFQMGKIAGVKNFAARQRLNALFEQQFNADQPLVGLLFEIGEIRLPNPRLLSKQARTDALTNLLMAILTPAVGAATRTETRSAATEAHLLAAIAVERYRLAHEKLPDALEVLVPTYLARLPIDPFNDQPVRYKTTDRGFVIYSVGENLKDDGGVEFLDERSGERGDWVLELKQGEN